MATMQPMDMTPHNIIAAARNTYRMNPTGKHGLAADVIVRQAAIGLGLDHPDYDDLVRDLVTADEVNKDAYRWVTGQDRRAARSTVPEGSQGGRWHVTTTSGWSGHTTG